MSAWQRRKAVAFYFTHTFAHTLWVLNGIKQLDDNSPDGQTRNRASISLPCFLLSLAFQPLCLYQHILTHTSPIPADIYIYIYSAPAAKQLPTWQFPWLINQSHRSSLDCQQNRVEVSELKTGIADESAAKHDPMAPLRRPLCVCVLVCVRVCVFSASAPPLCGLPAT